MKSKMLQIRTVCAALTVFFLLSVFVRSAYAQDITTGLISHFTMEETSGTTATDSGSLGNDGTFINVNPSTGSVQGNFGKAIDFRGGNANRIDMPDNATYQGLTAITFAAWIKPYEFINYQGIINIENLGTLNLGFSSNLLYFSASAWTSTGTWDTGSITLNEWQHVAVTYDYSDPVGTNPIIYINGKDAGALSEPFTPSGSFTAPGSAPAHIGNTNISGLTRNFKGLIDDARIYDRVLSPQDIKALYEAPIKSCELQNRGSVTYNTDGQVMQYCDSSNWVAMGKERYVPDAVKFDGTAAYLSILTDLTGTLDSKQLTGSIWLRRNLYGDGQVHEIYQSSGQGFRLIFDTSDRLRVIGENAAGTQILSAFGPTIADSDWHHVVFSVDMADQAASFMYVDDADVTSFTIFTDDVLDITKPSHVIGSSGGAANIYNGDIADFWLEFGAHLDLSVIGNRRKFIDVSGNPVDLGANGERPLGTAPDIFLSGETANWHTNKGTGGGFTENGSIETAFSDPASDNAGSWVQLGNELNVSGTGQPALTALTSSTIALLGEGSDNLGTYTWDGTDWSLVGNELNIPGMTDQPEIAALYENTVVIADTGIGGLATYTFDGTDWSQVGNTLAIAGIGWPAVTALNSNTIAYYDWLNKDIRTYTWDGTDWSQVGNDLNLPLDNISYITALDSTTIAYAGGNSLRTYTWDGTDWSQTGNSLNNLPMGNAHPVALTNKRIALWRHFGINNVRELEIYDWNGTDWNKTGASLHLAGAGLGDLGALGSDTVAFFDGGDNDLRTYHFTQCTTPDGHTGSLTYNTTTNQMQFCNGHEWIAMGPTGNGGGGCSNPNGTAGDLIFNTSFNRMQYCEGDEWIGIGGSGVNVALASGLVGYWTLDETSGSVIADNSGSGNNGAWTDGSNNDVAEETVTGQVDTAIVFDGGDRIDNGNDTSLQITGSQTWAAWINGDSWNSGGTDDMIVAKSTTTGSGLAYQVKGTEDCGGQHFAVQITSDGVYGSTDATQCSATTLATGTWYHVAAVYDDTGPSLNVYVNGVLDNGGTTGGAIPSAIHDSAANVTIGANANGSFPFNGTIDDVRIYNRALSDAEIAALYNATN